MAKVLAIANEQEIPVTAPGAAERPHRGEVPVQGGIGPFPGPDDADPGIGRGGT